MKKTQKILLGLMMLICGNAISQTGTQTKINTNKPNTVCIDTIIAKKIANDLVSGDVCKEEIKLVKENLSLTEKKVVVKDSIIKGLEEQKFNLNAIISEKDKQFQLQKDISDSFRKDLSKQKRTTFMYKALSLIGIASTGILILTK
jgi:transketolase